MRREARRAMFAIFARDALGRAATRLLWWFSISLAVICAASILSLLVRYDPAWFDLAAIPFLSAFPAFLFHPFSPRSARALVRSVDDHGRIEAFLGYPGGPASPILERACETAALTGAAMAPARRTVDRPLALALACSALVFGAALALSYASGSGLSIGYARGYWEREDAARKAAETNVERLAMREERPGEGREASGASKPAESEGTDAEAPDAEEPGAAREGRVSRPEEAVRRNSRGARPGDSVSMRTLDNGTGTGEADSGAESESRGKDVMPGADPGGKGKEARTDGNGGTGDGGATSNKDAPGDGSDGSRIGSRSGGPGYGTSPTGESREGSPMIDYRSAFASSFAARTGTELSTGSGLSERGLEEAIARYYGSASLSGGTDRFEDMDLSRVREAWSRIMPLPGGP